MNSTSHKSVTLLGSTGSIGRNTLDVIRRNPDRFSVKAISANKSVDEVRKQIAEFHPDTVVMTDPEAAEILRKDFGAMIKTGADALNEICNRADIDIVVAAMVGFAGLRPTIEAIRAGRRVAIANKETLVVAGELITSLLREYSVNLVPIDSEHSAILQCLAGEDWKSASRIILTASGGPFLNIPKEIFASITVEQALNHPNWKMGNKITIDSATLMNKGLEVIEAHWLFGLPAECIDVVIHPQSIIHSMVEFIDGSIKAQLGIPDMKLPIQYALTYPERCPMSGSRVDFPKLHSMTFFTPDRDKFRCLQLAYDAMALGGTAPAIMNAANEVAVQAFLEKKILFHRIPELIEQALAEQKNHLSPDLEHTFQSDYRAREFVRTLL